MTWNFSISIANDYADTIHRRYMSDDIKAIMLAIDNFTSEREWDQFHTPKNLAASLLIESAELMECFQWDNPSTEEVAANPKLLNQCSEEIADIFNYAFRLCSILSIDPKEAIMGKIRLNEEKYPVEKSKGSSKKYTDL